MRTLISVCRPYFGANVTEEMLEEWRPLMCPFDVTMAKGTSINYDSKFWMIFEREVARLAAVQVENLEKSDEETE